MRSDLIFSHAIFISPQSSRRPWSPLDLLRPNAIQVRLRADEQAAVRCGRGRHQLLAQGVALHHVERSARLDDEASAVAREKVDLAVRDQRRRPETFADAFL